MLSDILGRWFLAVAVASTAAACSTAANTPVLLVESL